MSGPELKPCPFCGAELTIGKQRIASCKTEGCMVQHRAVDLDYPKHIAAWNRRTPDPAQIRADAITELRAECQRRIDAAVLAEREAWHKAVILHSGDIVAIHIASIASSIRARGQK